VQTGTGTSNVLSFTVTSNAKGPALPSARAHHGFGQLGGYLYAFGGDSAAVTPNDSGYTNNATKLSQIAYAKINLWPSDGVGWR
jgi:hypothetical protein